MLKSKSANFIMFSFLSAFCIPVQVNAIQKKYRVCISIGFILFSINTLHAQTSVDCNVTSYVEKSGILVVETESLNAPAGWVAETKLSGYSGKSYSRWNGADYFNSPGNGLIQVKIHISTPGTYRFIWHSKICEGTSSTDSNDSWLKIPDAADFFAKNGSSVKYPNGGMFIQSKVVTKGSSSGGWMKVYSSGTTNWNWNNYTSDSDAHSIYATFNTAGVYTIQISARSKNHAIDRFVLYQEKSYSYAQATNLNLQETKCESVTGIHNLKSGKLDVSVSSISGSNYFRIKNNNQEELTSVAVYNLLGQKLLTNIVAIAPGSTYQLMKETSTNNILILELVSKSGKVFCTKIR